MAKQKTENEEYKRLLEKHEALDDLTDEALDTRREWFIQEVIDHYDMVEIGTLYFGDMAIDVESIYYDKTEHRLMVHISSKEMEGDIIYTSLQREKQGKLVELVFEEMKCLEEGPTLLGMMIDGNNILYRNVFIKELNAEVKVTIEEVFEAHIEEGSPDDDKEFLKATGRLTTCPQFFMIMDSVTDKKKDQIKALLEKMKQEGKPIDWATIVLC